ncbi:endonuclease/exonuclease/phosphatase family protein [Vibrio sp. ZSDZ34]|uniref:Endonuclease/exonuclease/phosphatase family protein n=1 Tax=Vibrio gelatinilyticus TaxID=2893468 RepID=A0A9X1WBX6_9VIBR|nr:endonuclease/exonuclease/phosphatase family protein [Vibrio gelatinilyticus]MCJ2377733.1 endonuclease/exonuclease/phosphatase family protein [Vibrio gelatinilyticus]
MKIKSLIILLFVSVILAVSSFHLIFNVPTSPTVTSIEAEQSSSQLHCYHNDTPIAIDQDGQLNVLVWNVYKQNRESLYSELTRYAQNQQLLLLQEASLDSEFLSWIKEQKWLANQVNAFKAFDVSAGVLNLGRHAPVLACAELQIEPWLRLPKSGIYAKYLLSNGEFLIVVNLHAINFTVGTKEYQQQLDAFERALVSHSGPILVAGDFNSWSGARQKALQTSLSAYGLQRVEFHPDHRKRFITGLALDHVFYRGMTLIDASTPISEASDHNPLLVIFRLD